MVKVRADMGGEPGEPGERGDFWSRSKRWERTLPSGEVGRGVRGMPWWERGRKRRVRFVPVEVAEFGGD